MRCKGILYLAGAALLGIVRGDLAIRTPGQRLTLRVTMSKAKYHEVTCLNEECDVKGLIPKVAKTSLCPGCAAAEGKRSKFKSTATKEEKQEQRKSASKRKSGLQEERAAERYRAIAAEHPLASPADRAAYSKQLTALIDTPIAAGEAFTHKRLG